MIRQAVIFLLTLSVTFLFYSFRGKPAAGKKQKIIKTIIVDAGHGVRANGGHDGARGSYSWEDDICLAVSKELVKQLHQEMPEIKIVESRPGKNIVSLHRRAEIANEHNGDLFLCIHVNAAVPIKRSELTGYKTVTSWTGKGKNRKKVTRKVPQYRHYTIPNPAKGTETYIWGSHKNEDKELAMRENAPMLQEENFKVNYGDIDPNSPEFIALSLLKTKQYFKRSATLAGFVQDEFAKVGRIDRDVRQRGVGIWVLQATAMPSILVETGYITNKAEEDYLNSAKGQEELAGCIIRAVKTYINWLDKQQQSLENNNRGQAGITVQQAAATLQAIEDMEKHNSR